MTTTTTATGIASATWAAGFREVGEGCGEVSRSLTQLVQNDDMLGAAAAAFAAYIGKTTDLLDAVSAKSEAIAPVMDEQAEYDRVFMQHPPLSAQDKVAAVVACHTGKDPQAIRDATDKIEEYERARERHAADTQMTADKLAALDLDDLPELEGSGDDKTPDSDGDDGPLGKKEDTTGDGGRGDDGTHVGGKDEPTPEAPPTSTTPDPAPSTTAPVTAAPSAPTTAAPISDAAAPATTQLSADGAIPLGASALGQSSGTAAVGANGQPVMPQVGQQSFMAGGGSVGANPNAPYNPARQAAAEKRRAEDEQTRRFAEAASPIAAAAAAGTIAAADAQATGPSTHATGAPTAPVSQTPTADRLNAAAAAHQAKTDQLMAQGGLGSGAKLNQPAVDKKAEKATAQEPTPESSNDNKEPKKK